MTSYKVLIRSHIDYCPFIPLVVSKSNLMVIETIQRKALGIIIRKPPYTPYRSYMKQAKSRSVNQIIVS
jgi:hypothetical protein